MPWELTTRHSSPERPSSARPSQSSSCPLQLSAAGTAALHGDSPEARQRRSPEHKPHSFALSQEVVAPSSANHWVHAHSPCSRTHWCEVFCVVSADSAQTYPSGQSPSFSHSAPQKFPAGPYETQVAPVATSLARHSALVMQGRHNDRKGGTQMNRRSAPVSSCRQTQSNGHSSRQLSVQRFPPGVWMQKPRRNPRETSKGSPPGPAEYRRQPRTTRPGRGPILPQAGPCPKTRRHPRRKPRPPVLPTTLRPPSPPSCHPIRPDHRCPCSPRGWRKPSRY